MMVVGSTINDVMKVTPPPPGALKDDKSGNSGGVTWDMFAIFVYSQDFYIWKYI